MSPYFEWQVRLDRYTQKRIASLSVLSLRHPSAEFGTLQSGSGTAAAAEQCASHRRVTDRAVTSHRADFRILAE